MIRHLLNTIIAFFSSRAIARTGQAGQAATEPIHENTTSYVPMTSVEMTGFSTVRKNHAPTIHATAQIGPESALNAYLTELRSNHKTSPATIRNYASDLRQFLHFTQLTQLEQLKNPRLQEAFTTDQTHKGLKTASIQRKAVSLHLFIKWLEKQGYLAPPMGSALPVARSAPPSSPPLAKIPQAPAESEKFFWFREAKKSASGANQGQTRNLPFNPYLGLSLVILLISLLAWFGYRQLIADVAQKFAFPQAPTTLNKILSFQGRLTDASGTPITTPTDVTFKIWSQVSGGDEGTCSSLAGEECLYSTGICSPQIDPDQDGIFSTVLGEDCGAAIPDTVFSEHANVWLEIKVGAETLAPRQRIATVPFAANADTLRGFPIDATASAVKSSVVVMNQWGELLIGEQSPRLRSISGTFQISGQTLSLTTENNGNIQLQPNGTGQVNLVGGTTSTNFLNVSSSTLSTGSLITGVVSNNNTGYKFLSFSGGSSPDEKFFVDALGNVAADGYLHVPGATISATYSGGVPLTVNGTGGTVFTIANNGNITAAGDLQLNGGDLTTASGDLTIAPAGGDTLFTGNILPSAADTYNLGSTTAEWNRLYLGDNEGLLFGLDQDWTFGYDEATDDRLELVTAGTSGFLLSSAVQTGIGANFSFNSLTSGSGLNVNSSAGSTFSGQLALIQYDPASATTISGDLLRINIASDGTTTGNLFNVTDNNSTLFSVSESKITSAQPHEFTSPGDVIMAYDLIFTNNTASYIKSSAPLYIDAGDMFESNDLTLRSYNAGDIILETAASGKTIITGNASIGGYATGSASLALGTASAEAGPGNLSLSGNFHLTGKFFDGATSAGSAGNVLTSTGTGTAWSAIGSLSVGNADTLDTLDSLQFLRSDTSDNYTSGTLAFDSGTTVDINGGISIADTDIALDGATTNLSTTGDLSVNTDNLFIQKSTGNIGIGTTTVTAKLDIAGTASTSGALAFRGTTDPKIDILNGENFGIRTSVGGDTGLAEKLTVLNNGNVGVGITTPATELDVFNATSPEFRLSKSTTNYFKLEKKSSSGSQIADVAQTGEALLDFDPITTDGTSKSSVRLFRNVTTSDTGTGFTIYLADGTSTVQSFFGAKGNSYFNASAGNFGIGDTTPSALLSVGNGDLFQVNSTGAIAAATGITSSGTITFSGLTADRFVRTTTGGQLTTAQYVDLATQITGVLPLANGGTNKNMTASAGSIAYSDADSLELTAVGNAGECLVSNGTSAPTWSSCIAAGGGSKWVIQNTGVLNPINNSADLILGDNSATPATASAKFAVLNLDSGTPTASVSATGVAGRPGIAIAGDGSIQSIRNGTLTLGGNTTGNITLSPLNGSGTVTSTGDFNLNSGKAYFIDSNSVLNATTLGSGVTSSSLTSVGALSSGSIASGFGTITTTNTITGTTLNGTTGINTGASAGTQRIDASGNLVNIGNITATGAMSISTTGDFTIDSSADVIFDADGADWLFKDAGTTIATLTNSSTDLSLDIVGGQFILADTDTINIGGLTGQAYNSISNSTTATYANDDNDLYVEGSIEIGSSLYVANSPIYVGGVPVSADAQFQNSSNLLHPYGERAGVADFALGGNSTASAKFIVKNVNTDTPVASISATTVTDRPGISIGGNGVIQSINNGTLTVGGNTTGNIIISPLNGNGSIAIGTTSFDARTVIDGNSATGSMATGDISQLLVKNSNSGGNAGIAIDRPNTVHSAGTYYQTSGTANWFTGISSFDVPLANNDFTIGPDDDRDNADFMITSVGRLVGIGSTSPNAKLDVLTTNDEKLRLTEVDDSVYTSFSLSDAGNLTVSTTGSSVYFPDIIQAEGGINRNAGDLALSTTSSGNITLSPVASSGLVNILTGNLKVGAGTPTVTLNGDDAYVTGTFEADGAVQLDGAVTLTSSFTQSGGTVSLNNDSNNAINIATGTSTGTVTVGGTGSQTIAIGNGAGVKTVNLGSNNTTSTTTILSGSGGVNINTNNNQPTNIGTGTSTGLISIGGGLGTVGVDTTNWDVAAATGNITTAGDIAINGGDLTSTATTFNFDIGNTGTLNFRDGTNSLVAIKDQGTYAFLNLAGKSTTGDPATCAEGDLYYNSTDDTMNVCHSGNTWEALNSTNSFIWSDLQAPTANLSLNLGSYTTQFDFAGTSTTGWTYNADSVNTGIGMLMSFDALSVGSGLSLTSTSTSLASGGEILNIDWSPDGTNTSTGNLVTINTGADDNVESMLNITDNGSTIFRVKESKITSAVPHEFTAAGDVAIAYDIQLTNQTASFIKSKAPLTIEAGEIFESNDLTLTTYNSGDINLNSKRFVGVGSELTAQSVLHVDSTNTATYGRALAIFNHDENQDILAASSSGTNRFRLTYDGNAILNASTYLNFGTASGTSGYGIRDNAGTIQFKNSAGSWTDIGTGASAWSDLTAPTANFTMNLTGYTTDFTSTATTANPWTFTADSLTSGTGHLFSFDGLTTGDGISITSTSTALTTGNLLDISYTGAGTTTSDLLYVNIGANSNVGSLLNLANNGSSLFKVTETQITSAVPHQFTAAGDVAIAYDISLTNQISSSIKSSAPLTIEAGESFENNNLTLKTYGTGATIASGKFSVGTQQTLTANSTTPSVAAGNLFITANSSGTVINNFTNGTAGQIIYVEIGDANTDFDCTSNANFNCGSGEIDILAAGDVATWIYDGTVWNLIGWMDTSADYGVAGGADLAEMYVSNDTLTAGEIVSIDQNQAVAVIKSQANDASRVIGVVSTQPHLIMGENDTAGFQAYPIALAGRVPVKMSNSSSAVLAGDMITISSESGKGQKATTAGFVVGRALENWNPNSGQDSVTIFVNPIWYDPQVYLTNNGLMNSTSVTTETLTATNANVSLLQVVQATISNLSGQIANFQQLITQRLTATQVETDLITPLSGKDLTLKIGQDGNDDTGKLVVENKNNEAVFTLDETGTATLAGDLNVNANASISGEVNAGSVRAQALAAAQAELNQLSVNEATLSGDLFLADGRSLQSLLSDNEAYLASLSAEASDLRASVEASPSAITAESFNEFLSQLTGSDDASVSAALQALNEQQDVNLTAESMVLAPDAIFIHEYLGVNGFAQMNSANVQTTLTVADSMLFTGDTISTAAETLFIQPTGAGRIDLLASTMIVDTNGTVTINGNLVVTGDAAISGSLNTNVIKPNDFSRELVLKLATESGTVAGAVDQSVFAIKDASDSAVASIDASGSARFSQLTAQGVVIQQPTSEAENLVEQAIEIDRNRTVGNRILPANQTDLVIENNNITADTLIYLTPTSDTANQVLYVKAKNDCAVTVEGDVCQKTFTVGLNNPINQNVTFNYWIVKQE